MMQIIWIYTPKSIRGTVDNVSMKDISRVIRILNVANHIDHTVQFAPFTLILTLREPKTLKILIPAIWNLLAKIVLVELWKNLFF